MSERVRQYEALADWLGEQEFSRNVRDYTDEYTTVATVDVEHLADALMRSDWLAAHDREVKAKVLREMADDWMYPDRKSRLFQDWLRETATSLESEAQP